MLRPTTSTPFPDAIYTDRSFEEGCAVTSFDRYACRIKWMEGVRIRCVDRRHMCKHDINIHAVYILVEFTLDEGNTLLVGRVKERWPFRLHVLLVGCFIA